MGTLKHFFSVPHSSLTHWGTFSVPFGAYFLGADNTSLNRLPFILKSICLSGFVTSIFSQEGSSALCKVLYSKLINVLLSSSAFLSTTLFLPNASTALAPPLAFFIACFCSAVKSLSVYFTVILSTFSSS